MILDRKLQERRTFPAINVPASGTRREERLLAPETMRQVEWVRSKAPSCCCQRLGKTKRNEQFLASIAKAMEAETS